MASQRLDLTIDIQNRRLVKSFNSNVSYSVPTLYQGDSQDLFLRFVNPTGRTDVPFDEVDPTAWTVKFGIGVIAAVPTGGTFTLTYGANTTSSLAYDVSAATLSTAFNLLASVISAGGATVSGSAGGPWTITFTAVGTRTTISGTATALVPVSQVISTQTQIGTASVQEIQRISLSQNPIAYQDTWTDAPAASISISSLQTGSGSASSIQNIVPLVGIYGGNFALNFGSYTTAAIAWDATGSDVQTALEGLTSIGADNVSVSGVSGGPWIVTFQGTLANAAQALITSVATGLIAPKGKVATLALNTAGIESALGSSSTVGETLEIEVIPSGSNRMTVLQTTCTIANDLIEGAPAIPTPTTSYYSVTESENAFVQNRYTFTGVTGGGSTNIDGLVTTGRTVGQIIAYTTTTFTTLYQLKSGTDAENAPSIIRPDDYAASTNEKVWKRLDVYTPTGASAAVSGSLLIKNYGTTVVTAATILNFTGAGVTVTASGNTAFINIAAASGGAVSFPTYIVVAASDETNAITAGTQKVTWRMPFAMTVTAARGSLTTGSTSGLVTFDINESGTTILSTKITIDANESTSQTAATPPVISDASLADDAEMTVDFDTVGTGAKGAKVYLIGYRT